MLANEAVLNGGGFYFRGVRTQVKVTGTTFADNMARELAVLKPPCTRARNASTRHMGSQDCRPPGSPVVALSVSSPLINCRMHTQTHTPLVRRGWELRRCVGRDVAR